MIVVLVGSRQGPAVSTTDTCSVHGSPFAITVDRKIVECPMLHERTPLTSCRGQ